MPRGRCCSIWRPASGTTSCSSSSASSSRCCRRSSARRGSSPRPRCWGRSVPIAGIAGDQQAALFGQACFAPGEAKATYGTGTFVLVNLGERLAPVSNGVLGTAAAVAPAAPAQFAAEGSVLVGGAALQWLRDGLGVIADRSRVRGARGRSRLDGRRVLRPGADGSGLAAMGSERPRLDLRSDAGLDRRASRARRARGDRPPGGGRARCSATGGRRPARRRRRERERASSCSSRRISSARASRSPRSRRPRLSALRPSPASASACGGHRPTSLASSAAAARSSREWIGRPSKHTAKHGVGRSSEP